MSTHTLSANGFSGTIAVQRLISDEDALCVVDLAPRSLGLESDAYPTTLLRGTVTYTRTAGGQCMAVEHTVHTASGAHLTSENLLALTDALMPFAAEELRHCAVNPVSTVQELAQVIPMDKSPRRAYA